MDYREKMIAHLALVEQANLKLSALAPIIAKEVEKQHGRKIRAARTPQEQENLRHFYVMQLGRENPWKQSYLSDRDVAMRMATMYGVAALVGQGQLNEPF